jgi:NAD-dependent protein deacetylase/lipoamidase sirtuin 4
VPELDESASVLSELFRGGAVAVLTGAGCSTESGIPDYRGPETRRRATNPIEYRQFLANPSARQRYWARALLGWRLIRDAQPNSAHRAIAELETSGFVSGVITQNVDRLHHAAGSRAVIELHGALHEVKCLSCGELEARDAVQKRMAELNPNFEPEAFELAPDGDADLDGARIADFRVAGCTRCGGDLKPNVVFFGENVPRSIVERAFGVVSASAALLVVGSSLTVFSGYRFVKRAAELGLPVGLVNLGPSRADDLARVRVAARAGEVLPALAERLQENS